MVWFGIRLNKVSIGWFDNDVLTCNVSGILQRDFKDHINNTLDRVGALKVSNNPNNI